MRNLSQEVAELFKNLVGHEAFSHAYSNTKQSASETREKRKIQNAFEVNALKTQVLILLTDRNVQTRFFEW